ncbi:MAG: branched-chain amino acid ABC transporter permease [Betaproteobacteria bacterium]|nr:branched-chain amino acid ABC transporter permease [Betaproteobacteria bacterium]
MTRRSSGLLEGTLTLAIAVAAIFLVSGNPYLEAVALLTATYAFISLGMYLPFIMGGALSMAYNAYLGLGAYAMALVATRTTWDLAWAVPIGALLAAAVAVVLGMATRRLSGFYLAAVTLLFGIAFSTWLVDAEALTGGSAGIQSLRAPSLDGQPVGNSVLVAITILAVWLVGLLLSRLRASPFGIVVRTQRRAAIAVESAGVRVSTLSLVTLAVGAMVAALGGSMFAVVNHAVLPESFVVELVFLTMFMPLLGGQDRPWGAILGAVLVVTFTFQLTFFKSTGSLFFSLAVLLVLVAAPRGILGYLLLGWNRLLGRTGGDSGMRGPR